MIRAATLLLCLTALAATEPAAAEPAWLGPGPHEVSSADLVLVDEAREREVPLRIYAPTQAPGPLPVLVFSHGLGGDRSVYAYIARRVASHGYLSVHPQHLGSDAEVGRAGLLAMAAAAVDPAQRRARVADLELVLDSLPGLDHPLVAGRIDADSIAVGGHSFGAYAALVLGGQALSLPDEDDRVATDPRVDAVIALSPLGSGPLGLHPGSWDALAVPTLFVTGTADTTIGTADWRSRLEPFRCAPVTPRYLAVVEGLRHHALGDYHFAHAPVRRDPRHHPWVLAVITAFLDARLRNDPAAQRWLAGDVPVALETEGGLEWQGVVAEPP